MVFALGHCRRQMGMVFPVFASRPVFWEVKTIEKMWKETVKLFCFFHFLKLSYYIDKIAEGIVA